VASDKRGAKRSHLPLIFLDESGFMLQPVRRRTWAPSGQTPIQYAWDRHDRLSAIALIGLSPMRRHLSLYFQLVPDNVDSFHTIWLLKQLHRHLRRKAILIWDRWNVHRSAAAYFETEHPDWFRFEWLPAYAPDLNPVEQCWNHAKYTDLANFIPDDIDHLETAASESIQRQANDQQLLRSYFSYCKLKL
jgi:transposase